MINFWQMQRNLFQPNGPPYNSALLLTDREVSSVIDRQALRSVGVMRIRLTRSGALAAKNMAQRVSRILLEETEIVVCLPKLADMNAVQFAALIRSHPLLAHIPMLAVVSEPGQEKPLKDSGFNAVITRPFNSTTLLNKLHEVQAGSEQAQQSLLAYLSVNSGVPSSAQFEENLKAFAVPDNESISSGEAMRRGMELAREHEWEQALPFLQKAASDPRTRGDAGLLLSVYWRASGDEQKVYEALCDSLDGYLDNKKWDRARSLAKKLNTEYPGKPSQILSEILAKVRRNQFDLALKLVSIAKEISEQADIAEAISTGCKLSLTPKQTLAGLTKMLAEAGHTELAAELAPPNAGKGGNPLKTFLWFKIPQKAPASETKEENEAEGNEAEGNEAARIYEQPYPHTAWQDKGPEQNAAPLRTSGKTPEFGRTGPVIAPLGSDPDYQDNFTPSALGDAWTIVKGIVLLNKKKRPKDDQ